MPEILFKNEKQLSKGIRTLNVNPILTRWGKYLWIKRNRVTWQHDNMATRYIMIVKGFIREVIKKFVD